MYVIWQDFLKVKCEVYVGIFLVKGVREGQAHQAKAVSKTLCMQI